MKLKRSFKRWLSILLAVAVLLTTVMPTPVYAVEAGGNDVTSSMVSAVEHEMEKTEEAQADAVSPDSKTNARQTALRSRILRVPDFNANMNSFPILLRRLLKSLCCDSNDVSYGCSGLTQFNRTSVRNCVLRQATRDFTMLVKSGHSYRPFAFKIQDTCKNPVIKSSIYLPLFIFT